MTKSQQKLHKNIDSVIQDYTNGLSMKGLMAKYKHNAPPLIKVLLDANIKIRTSSDCNKRYSWDETFFEQIDTHEKAYWLGFIYADGNVRVKNGKDGLFQISLAKIDEMHLEKLKTSLKSNHRIYDDQDCKRIIISQNKIYTDLVNLGCLPNKSLVLEFPTEEQVPSEFHSSFVLGYFDGDGSISYNGYRWEINVVGTYNFLSKIQQILDTKASLPITKLSQEKRRAHGKTYYLVLGGGIKTGRSDRFKRLYDFLYSASPIHLDRKYAKMLEVLTRYQYNKERNGHILQPTEE